MSKSHTFEASVRWTGAREGTLEAEGLPALSVASPPEFSGTAGRWTPEHFFVASAEVCVMLTFLAIAEMSKLSVKGYGSKARGTVEKVEKGYRFTSIDIDVEVEVEKESDVERAKRIVDKAEASCLVSASMETPVRVSSRVDVAS